MNKLINYLPKKVYEENKEIEHLTNAEIPEIEQLWESVKKVRDNQFIVSSDSNRLRLWERLLKIRPNFATQSLDYRKEVVLLRLGLTPPFTYRWLLDLLNERVGSDKYTISLEHNNYRLDIHITHEDINMINEFRVFFRRVLPANLQIVVTKVDIKEVKPIKIYTVARLRTQNTHISRPVERADSRSKISIKTIGLVATQNTHISKAVVNPSPPVSEGGNEEVQTLVTCESRSEIQSNSYKDITIPIPYKKYELKTIRVSNKTNNDNIIVSLFDSFQHMEVYKSHNKNSIYDIINIPVEDKMSDADNKGNVYLKIENLGNSDIIVNYEIKLLNLK